MSVVAISFFAQPELELNMFPLQSQNISSYYEHVQVCLVNLIYRERHTETERGGGGGETETGGDRDRD